MSDEIASPRSCAVAYVSTSASVEMTLAYGVPDSSNGGSYPAARPHHSRWPGGSSAAASALAEDLVIPSGSNRSDSRTSSYGRPVTDSTMAPSTRKSADVYAYSPTVPECSSDSTARRIAPGSLSYRSATAMPSAPVKPAVCVSNCSIVGSPSGRKSMCSLTWSLRASFPLLSSCMTIVAVIVFATEPIRNGVSVSTSSPSPSVPYAYSCSVPSGPITAATTPGMSFWSAYASR
ncbi:hypothetical protein L0C25_16740 [Solicola gregarius]|uniref:Uncharacterized protein n=1 Tax=Solicola gregarius TaxID=2908642 RepID=A0AA46TFA5_9ACTN|nr:hypothetical protein [Solicola gregarius]UYM04180.1 hypothetical protein L0C25_16740 [Solicola gregarius]